MSRVLGYGVLAVAAVVGLVVAVASRSYHGPERDEGGRQALVDDMTEAVWEATGVDGGDVLRLDYEFVRRPQAAGCRDVDDEYDRWFARRRSRVDGGAAPQAEVVDGVAAWLAAEGFAVERYRSTGSPTRVVVGVDLDDQLAVDLLASEDGNLALLVEHTPCIAHFPRPEAPYVREDPT